MSNIDPTKPTAGQATTQSVRDNFQAAADEIDALSPGGAQAFSAYLAGYLDTGFTEQFVGDCDDIAVNSRYRATSNSATNLPPDADSTQLYIETIMQANTSSRMQYVYGQKGTNLYKIWTRTFESATWGAWQLVVDGGAFPQRLAGYNDAGAIDTYLADVDDLSANSTWRVGTGTTNLPSDFALSAWGFLTTFQSDAIRVTQILYGRGGSNAYKIWMRHNNAGTWSAWQLVVDGNIQLVAIGKFTGVTGAPLGNTLSMGTTNIGRTGTGNYTITFSRTLTSSNNGSGAASCDNSGLIVTARVTSANTAIIRVTAADGSTPADPNEVNYTIHGQPAGG